MIQDNLSSLSPSYFPVLILFETTFFLNGFQVKALMDVGFYIQIQVVGVASVNGIFFEIAKSGKARTRSRSPMRYLSYLFILPYLGTLVKVVPYARYVFFCLAISFVLTNRR